MGKVELIGLARRTDRGKMVNLRMAGIVKMSDQVDPSISEREKKRQMQTKVRLGRQVSFYSWS